jgi:hypothetical protein
MDSRNPSVTKERRPVGRQHLRDVVDHALGHRQGAIADLDREEQFALGVHRDPHPLGGTGQALDGLGLRDLAILDRTEHRIELIELQLLDVQAQRKEAEKARRCSAASISQCNTVFASTSKTRAVARMPNPSAKQASTWTISSTAACLP